jgi:hypothetical protein
MPNIPIAAAASAIPVSGAARNASEEPTTPPAVEAEADAPSAAAVCVLLLPELPSVCTLKPVGEDEDPASEPEEPEPELEPELDPSALEPMSELELESEPYMPLDPELP